MVRTTTSTDRRSVADEGDEGGEEHDDNGGVAGRSDLRVRREGSADWASLPATEPSLKFYSGNRDRGREPGEAWVLGTATQTRLLLQGGYLTSRKMHGIISGSIWHLVVGYH